MQVSATEIQYSNYRNFRAYDIVDNYRSREVPDASVADTNYFADAIFDNIVATCKETDTRTFLLNLYLNEDRGRGYLEKAIDIALVLDEERMLPEKDPGDLVNAYMIAFMADLNPSLFKYMSRDAEDKVRDLIDDLDRLKLLSSRSSNDRSRSNTRDNRGSRDRGRGRDDYRRTEPTRGSRVVERQGMNKDDLRDSPRKTTPRNFRPPTTQPRGQSAREREEAARTRREIEPTRNDSPREDHAPQIEEVVDKFAWISTPKNPYRILNAKANPDVLIFLDEVEGDVVETVTTVSDLRSTPEKERSKEALEALVRKEDHVTNRGSGLKSPFDKTTTWRSLAEAALPLQEVKSYQLAEPSKALASNPDIFDNVLNGFEVSSSDDEIAELLTSLYQKEENGNTKPNPKRIFYTKIESRFGHGVKDLLKNLSSCITFSQMGRVLNMATTEIIDKKKTGVVNARVTESTLSHIEYIDRLLYRRLLDLLQIELQYNIQAFGGSFNTIMSKIYPALTKHSGGDAIPDALLKLENNEAINLFRTLQNSSEVDEKLTEAKAETTGVSAEYIGMIKIPKSLTLLPFSSRELDLELVKGEAKLLNEEVTPSLFHAAESLFSQTEGFTVKPIDNYLLTTDGVRYKIYQTTLISGNYTISLA